MRFKEVFNDLSKKYKLTYKYQEFENCYGGGWFVYTHSLYNDSGCFTIHCLPQRFEVEFYYAEKFSNELEKLCGEAIDVFDVEKDIWNKREKLWFFKKPFFYCSPNRIIETLIEVIEVSIEKRKEFFGIKIS